MSHLRAEMYVCGVPKPLEDTVMMMTRFAGDVPGTLVATRIASGNWGGLCFRVFGSEGEIEEAWGNLYTEFAMAVAARKDGAMPPAGWLNYPTVEQGAQGVRFIEAAVESHKACGEWVDCRLKL